MPESLAANHPPDYQIALILAQRLRIAKRDERAAIKKNLNPRLIEFYKNCTLEAQKTFQAGKEILGMDKKSTKVTTSESFDFKQELDKLSPQALKNLFDSFKQVELLQAKEQSFGQAQLNKEGFKSHDANAGRQAKFSRPEMIEFIDAQCQKVMATRQDQAITEKFKPIITEAASSHFAKVATSRLQDQGVKLPTPDITPRIPTIAPKP